MGELSRARLNRPALARAIASLGIWVEGETKVERERAEKERERAEKERERAEKEQERRRVKQTELLQLRGMLSARGAIGEILFGWACDVRLQSNQTRAWRPAHVRIRGADSRLVRPVV